jgi:hypothetical protein
VSEPVADYGPIYGEFMIPRGNWNWMLSFKDDYNYAHPDAMDNPAFMRPTPYTFEIGETVKAARYQNSAYINDHLKLHVHVGHTGIIVGKDGDRCYLIQFDDGKTVGFYHNEIDRIEE